MTADRLKNLFFLRDLSLDDHNHNLLVDISVKMLFQEDIHTRKLIPKKKKGHFESILTPNFGPFRVRYLYPAFVWVPFTTGWTCPYGGFQK